MKYRTRIPTLAVLFLAGACYHQVVNTGLTPSSTTIEKPWVATYVWGLVAAQPIDVRLQCPNSVAVVETQQSFANGLVGALTLGLYAPQTVKITCAGSGRAGDDLPEAQRIDIPKNATHDERIAYTNDAIRRSIESHKTIVLTF